MFENFVKKSFGILAITFFLGSIFGSELRADYYVIPSEITQDPEAVCGEGTSFEKDLRSDLNAKAESGDNKQKLQLILLIQNLRMACFKSKKFDFGTTEDHVVLVLYTSETAILPEAGFFNIYVNNFINNVYLKSKQWKRYGKKTRPIKKTGSIMRDTETPAEADVPLNLTTTKFIDLVKDQNVSFKKLIQNNLSISYDPNDPKACEKVSNTDDVINGFYQNEIDGDFGPGSEQALEGYVKLCSDTNEITAKMISHYLLPQLFVWEAMEPKEESSAEVDGDNSSSTQLTAKNTPADADIQNVLELHEGEPSSKANNQRLEADNERLEAYNKSLEADNKKLKARAKKKQKEFYTQPITSLWSTFGINVVGSYPPYGQEILLRQMDIKLKKSTYCFIDSAKSLLENALNAYQNEDCLEYNWEDSYEIDKARDPEVDSDLKKITFFMIKKYASTVSSIKSEPFEGLSNKSFQSCAMEYLVSKSGQGPMDPDQKYGILYSNWKPDSEQVFLQSDPEQPIEIDVEDAEIHIRHVSDSPCTLPDNFHLRISTEEKYNGAPAAVINRAGQITLKNLPIQVIKGDTLVVFFDINVGYEGKKDYAFNGSLDSEGWQQAQKSYFSAFIKALKDHVEGHSNLEKVLLYKAVGPDMSVSDRAEDEEYEPFVDTSGEPFSGAPEQINDVLDNFFKEFTAGQRGEFSSKKTLIKRLQKDNVGLKFLSFGPSGEAPSKVCTESRFDYNDKVDANFLIIDILPRPSIAQLSENNDVLAEDDFSYSCKDRTNVVNFTAYQNISPKDGEAISNAISNYLNKKLGE